MALDYFYGSGPSLLNIILCSIACLSARCEFTMRAHGLTIHIELLKRHSKTHRVGLIRLDKLQDANMLLVWIYKRTAWYHVPKNKAL